MYSATFDYSCIFVFLFITLWWTGGDNVHGACDVGGSEVMTAWVFSSYGGGFCFIIRMTDYMYDTKNTLRIYLYKDYLVNIYVYPYIYGIKYRSIIKCIYHMTHLLACATKRGTITVKALSIFGDWSSEEFGDWSSEEFGDWSSEEFGEYGGMCRIS